MDGAAREGRDRGRHAAPGGAGDPGSRRADLGRGRDRGRAAPGSRRRPPAARERAIHRHRREQGGQPGAGRAGRGIRGPRLPRVPRVRAAQPRTGRADGARAGRPAPPRGPRPASAPLKVAIVGRPNVGKSSYINQLLGSDRVIVSDVPGTTRDSIDVPFSLGIGRGRAALRADRHRRHRGAWAARTRPSSGSACSARRRASSAPTWSC